MRDRLDEDAKLLILTALLGTPEQVDSHQWSPLPTSYFVSFRKIYTEQAAETKYFIAGYVINIW